MPGSVILERSSLCITAGLKPRKRDLYGIFYCKLIKVVDEGYSGRPVEVQADD